MIIKTLEEAIEVLKDLRSEMEDARDRIAVNAINMVLEAVKEPKRGKWSEEFDESANPFCPNCGADMREGDPDDRRRD